MERIMSVGIIALLGMVSLFALLVLSTNDRYGDHL